jgi:hypothetical protein
MNSAAGEGTDPMDFLSAPLGPRSVALGGGGAALGGDGATAILNPAALGRLPRGEASFAGHDGMDFARSQSLGVAVPVTGRGTWAARWTQVDYGDIPGYDSTANSLGNVTAQDNWLQAAWGGRAFSDKWWWGAAFNGARETLGSESASTLFLDMGILHQLPATRVLPNARIGLSIRRLGPDVEYGPNSYSLPREIRLAAATEYFADRLRISGDLSRLHDGRNTLQTGLEFTAGGGALFRLGYNSALDDGLGLSYGLGVRAWDIQVDYAYTPMPDLGDSHWLGFTYRFGNMAEKYFEKGMEFLRQEDDANAVIWFSRALEVDPTHTGALVRLREATGRLEKQWKDLTPTR